MKHLLLISGIASLITFAPGPAGASANPPSAPDLEQVRDILRTNLPGISDTDLNRYAFEGWLQGLRDRVWLMTAPTNRVATADSKSLLLEDGIGYVRIETITPAAAEELRTACQALDATNRLKGVVLDLRFATGDDYAAATAVADLFVAEERGLLDWGAGVIKSSAKTNTLTWPVAVLINGETMGAAEALAAIMRETGNGLLLGNPTRGAAVLVKEFALTNGQRLRIAATPVNLIGETITPIGRVTPDIEVTVTPEEERIYLNDPYSQTAITPTTPNGTAAGTNRVTRRPRTSEADLVRAHRSGNRADIEAQLPREPEPEKPLLRDPALARAVDLLKGLAVVRRIR